MFSAGELIEALQRRLRRGRSIRPPRPAGEFPPGWTEWFREAAPETQRTRAAIGEMVAVFLARQPVFRTGYRRLGGWQAFIRLWRYDWREEPSPDRRRRVLSMAGSVLLHLLWLQLMVLLMVAHYPGAEEDERLGETITQVEFIGEGTPQDDGGGSQLAEQPLPEAAAAPLPAAARAASEPEAAPPPPPSPPPSVAEVVEVRPEAIPPPSVVEVEIAPEPTPSPIVLQPLEVTETPVPDIDFVLPPPRIDAPPTPALPDPELRAHAPEVRMLEVPTLASPPELQPLPGQDIRTPDLRQPDIGIVEREVLAPAPRIALRPTEAAAAPELRGEGPAIVQRDIELRAPAPGAGSAEQAADGQARDPASATGQLPSAATAAGGAQGSGQGATPSATAAGAGPASAPAPGAMPSPRPGDDWGDSDRRVPGGQAGSPSGLFNADGSPRLAGGTGTVGGGLPPGTITEDYEKIDRMGTWLKRPPIGYEPTAFDRFWVPHENLLEEWVRRSIKEVLIPIPGTSKRIKCAVALLMLGGACGITDPNLQDVEADARKPPDVPFKRELQEDQDSL